MKTIKLWWRKWVIDRARTSDKIRGLILNASPQIQYPLTIWRSQLVSSWYRMSVASPRKRGRGGWSSCKRQFASRTRWLSCNWIKKAKDNSQEKDKPDERTKERGQTLDLKVNGLVSLRKSYGSTTANIYTVWSLTTRTRGQGQQGVALHKEAKRPPMNPTNSNLYIESSCSFKVDPFLTAIE